MRLIDSCITQLKAHGLLTRVKKTHLVAQRVRTAARATADGAEQRRVGVVQPQRARRVVRARAVHARRRGEVALDHEEERRPDLKEGVRAVTTLRTIHRKYTRQ